MNNTQQPPILPITEELRQRLAKELELYGLTSQEQAEVITKLGAVILDRLTITLISKLPEEIMPHVDTLLEAGQTEAVTAIIQKHVKNIDTISDTVIYDTITQFKTMNDQAHINTKNE